MKNRPPDSTDSKAGFTLVEVGIASTVLLAVVVGSLSVFLVLQNTWFATSLNLRASSKVSNALTKIVYGAGSTNAGVREADISEAILYSGGINGRWQIQFFGTNSNEFVDYNPANGIISNQHGFIFCDNVTTSSAAFQNNGCRIQISVREIGGRNQADATMSTFVRFRN